MDFIDLNAQYRLIAGDIQDGFQTILENSRFIMGPEVFEMEQRLAEYVGVKHCVSLSSGTDALLAALMALDIAPGDEVITTPFSFIATAEVIIRLGATPVFIDIDPRSYNLDVNLLEAAITPRTKAVLPVNLYGQCAEFDTINAIAERHGLAVVEDAAQSFGAGYYGRRSGALGSIGCCSFFPSKPLGCYGDGGACFTDDDGLAEDLRRIRLHGQDRHYHHVRIGITGRMDTLQAAVILAKMRIFPDEMVARGKVARRYDELLAGLDCETPGVAEHNTSAYAQYTIQVAARERFCETLKQRGIPTAIHYPTPLHLQPAVQRFARSVGDLPIAVRAAQRVVSLPMHPYLCTDDSKTIAAAVADALDGGE